MTIEELDNIKSHEVRFEIYLKVVWGLRLLGLSTLDSIRCGSMLVDCQFPFEKEKLFPLREEFYE